MYWRWILNGDLRLVLQVAMSSFAVQRAAKSSPVVRRWAPTAIGLGVIPLIIHPIDSFVDAAMDKTVRKWSKAFVDDIDK